MKVDSNDPTFPVSEGDYRASADGIPVRLWIATQLLAPSLAQPDLDEDEVIRMPLMALVCAEELIRQHNEMEGA